MAKRTMESLTEPMYYILLALHAQPMCGIDIADFIIRRTKGRVQVGPGTLYTILGKFEKEQLIEQIQLEGRKRTYRITGKGQDALLAELRRIRLCLADAESEGL